ncbi:MAG: hypothetical protein IT267_10310 [Saprospiraceae bacterium]|nr:hypothetical protein [Saprospiraceae bacterium]
MPRLILLFVVFVSLLACSKDSIYSHSISIPDEIWKESNNLEFSWKINDTITRYDLLLNICFTDKIPNQNIYVKAISKNPEAKTSEQLISLELLDPSGVPYGSCDLGSCKVSIILASNIYFPMEGEYSLAISPFSRIDSFPGIKNVILNIEKTSVIKSKKTKSAK